MFCGGIEESEDGVVGDVGLLLDASVTAPGGGGTFDFASKLCDPGRKTGSELRMLSFAVESGFDESAKVLTFVIVSFPTMNQLRSRAPIPRGNTFVVSQLRLSIGFFSNLLLSQLRRDAPKLSTYAA